MGDSRVVALLGAPDFAAAGQFPDADPGGRDDQGDVPLVAGEHKAYAARPTEPVRIPKVYGRAGVPLPFQD